jgi:LPXTG-motif cell wall-anchored protein
MKSILAALVTMVCVAGPLTAQPTTSPPAMFHTEPMVLGQVTEVTSHSATVRTSKGEQMEFEFDSRTLMPTPAQLTPETPVKVLFRTLDSGLHLAKRITALEPGSLDYARLEYELAMYESERERLNAARTQQDAQTAAMAADPYRSEPPPASERREETAQRVDDESRADATRTDATRSDVSGTEGTSDELPRTASNQGWLLPIGLGALALAVAARFARRRRAA